MVESCVVPNVRRRGSPVEGWDRLTTIFPFVVFGRANTGERAALDDDRSEMKFVNVEEGSQISFDFPTDLDSAIVINLNNEWKRLDG